MPMPFHQKSMAATINLSGHPKNHLGWVITVVKSLFKYGFVRPIPNF